MLTLRALLVALVVLPILFPATQVSAQSCAGILSNGQVVSDGTLLYQDAKTARWQLVNPGSTIPLYGTGAVSLAYVVQETWGDVPRAGMVVVKSARFVDDSRKIGPAEVKLSREAQERTGARCNLAKTNAWSGKVSAETYDRYHDLNNRPGFFSGDEARQDYGTLVNDFHSQFEGRKGECKTSDSDRVDTGFGPSNRSQFSFDQAIVREGLTFGRQVAAVVRIGGVVADTKLFDRQVQTRRYSIAGNTNVACIRLSLKMTQFDHFLRIVDLEGLDESNRAKRQRGPERSWIFAR